MSATGAEIHTSSLANCYTMALECLSGGPHYNHHLYHPATGREA